MFEVVGACVEHAGLPDRELGAFTCAPSSTPTPRAIDELAAEPAGDHRERAAGKGQNESRQCEYEQGATPRRCRQRWSKSLHPPAPTGRDRHVLLAAYGVRDDAAVHATPGLHSPEKSAGARIEIRARPAVAIGPRALVACLIPGRWGPIYSGAALGLSTGPQCHCRAAAP
jgi:hypothetical protein